MLTPNTSQKISQLKEYSQVRSIAEQLPIHFSQLGYLLREASESAHKSAKVLNGWEDAKRIHEQMIVDHKYQGTQQLLSRKLAVAADADFI